MTAGYRALESERLHDPDEFKAALAEWLEQNAANLAPYRRRHPGPIEVAFAHDNPMHQCLGAAGWTAFGWPVESGGLGGTAVLRAILYEELTSAGYIIPEALEVVETIGPMLCTYAPHIAVVELPAFVMGQRLWCQGFSEPDAGSDLASVRTRAVEDGDQFVVNGQKTWVSFGHMADACGLLVRTGEADSRHRGLSILWVDLSLPGVTVRPIKAASGRNEFSELFFDNVMVPKHCLVGDLNNGWAVAMHLLQFERGMYAWMRQARLHRRLEQAMEAASGSDRSPTSALSVTVGGAYLAMLSLRLRCRTTVIDLAEGAFLGPAISVDKLLLSSAEQTTLDACRSILWPHFEIDDGDAEDWRADWFYTRAASIYGGSAEVQREIVAERLLGLPAIPMTTLDSEELALFRISLERALKSVDNHNATATLDGLDGLGWPDLHHVDPQLAVTELFEMQGRLVVASQALDFVVANSMGLTSESIAKSPKLLHPLMANWSTPPGLVTGPEIKVDGLVIGNSSRTDSIMVPCRSVGQELCVAELTLSALEQDRMGGIDPSLHMMRVHGQSAVVSREANTDWGSVCAAAQRALGHEMLGLIGEILTRTIAHVIERVQFGRSIASFQSVRHRLTEVYVAHAATQGALEAAWATGDELAANAAKALAGVAGALAGKHCLQVTGAIGFTWEYGLHQMMRRVAVLDALYGSTAELQARIGARLLEDCVAPRIYPLA